MAIVWQLLSPHASIKLESSARIGFVVFLNSATNLQLAIGKRKKKIIVTLWKCVHFYFKSKKVLLLGRCFLLRRNILCQRFLLLGSGIFFLRSKIGHEIRVTYSKYKDL